MKIIGNSKTEVLACQEVILEKAEFEADITGSRICVRGRRHSRWRNPKSKAVQATVAMKYLCRRRLGCHM